MAEWVSSFRQMDDATPYEIVRIFAAANEEMHAAFLPNLLGQLEALKGPTFGYRVDRYEHSLQSATRAAREGARDDLVVAALLHDIGDNLGPTNHAEVSATILGPYLDEEATWIVRHHTVFQRFHWGRQFGIDPDVREQFRDHPYFDTCAHFCSAWDQASFDETYDTWPLEEFLPILERVFSRTPEQSLDPA
ncbi:HD domain-containing protein [soil metagenome]